MHLAEGAEQSVSDAKDWTRTWSRMFSPRAYLEQPKVPAADRARHLLLLLRLQRVYFAYCFACVLISSVLFLSTFGRAIAGSEKDDDRHKWPVWQSVLEFAIGLVVCSETFSTFWLAGRSEFLRDPWCIFDAVVVVLTLLHWSLTGVLSMLLELDSIDLPLLTLRFFLQPCRVVAAVSMMRRVMSMQQSTVDISLGDDGGVLTPRSPGINSCQVMTPELQRQISAHFPRCCRYSEWHLAYSSALHGHSLDNFFKNQGCRGDHPNVIVCADAEGHIMGGFANESWSLCAHGFGSEDCFVFAAEDGAMQFFPATREPGVATLWTDERMMAFGIALIVHKNLALASTEACTAFGSPALHSASACDIPLLDFECWVIGGQTQAPTVPESNTPPSPSIRTPNKVAPSVFGKSDA